jgi:catechol 2,3-dioxygenase-like lactoylglutathione lyase family enzyme
MFTIGHIEFFVQNAKEAKKFYCDVLGFELVVEQGDFVWVKCGSIEILLRPGKLTPATATYQDASNAIVLYTDNVAATATALQSRGLVFRGTDGSDDCLTFTDLDGHWFQLANPN